MRAFLIAATVLAACATPPPESQTPTITSTSVTPSPVPANADGSYTFNVKFSFSDDVNVETYHFVIGPSMLDGSVGTPAHNGTTNFNVQLAAGTPSGTIDYTVTIADEMSRMSDDGQGTVTLSPP
jgi:hypothetical protein